jgi:hypothetical protein
VYFLLLLLIIQFSFPFSLGRGQSVLGAMLIWPRIVCGSTAYHFAHLVVCVFPAVWELVSGSGVGALLVSPFNVEWECYAWLRMWRSQSFASSLVLSEVLGFIEDITESASIWKRGKG